MRSSSANASGVTPTIAFAIASSNGRSTASPSMAALNSCTLSSPIPAMKSRSLGVGGRGTGDGRRGDDPLGEQCGARERMRSSAGDAPGGEALDPERVRDRRGVGGDGGDVAPRVAVRAAVSGAVVADQPDPAVGGIGDPLRVSQPGTGRSVVLDDGRAVRIAVLEHRERPPARGGDLMRAHGGETTLC